MRGHAAPIVLLGPQRFSPTLSEAAAAIGIDGPVAVITAGWREREGEDEELDRHLGGRTTNLRLYRRSEEVWDEDEELREAHAARQELLRHKQRFYRVRLEHTLLATYQTARARAPKEVLDDELGASIRLLRALDRDHIDQCLEIHERFEIGMRLRERPSLRRHREQIEAVLRDHAAVAIAGGHVATLLNRLTLFGLDELVEGMPVLAWSAGAMAISERVVLFHDSPPHGQGAAEILDRGLGLCPDVVALPSPEQRLRMEDRLRVSILARRFGPAACLALPNGAYIRWQEGRFGWASGALCLRPGGVVERLGRRGGGGNGSSSQEIEA